MSMSFRGLRRLQPALMKGLLFAIAGILFPGAALVPGAALAFGIHGTVVNGTTGKPAGLVTVAVIDPRQGMATEEEIKTDAQGRFAAEDLNDKISIYLLQVNYKGVTYTEMVRPSGEERVHVELEVYETTTEWDDVRVSIPHLMMRRSHDTLTVDRIFMISNNTDPPRTVTGEGAGFRIYFPEERLRIASLFVTSLGIPISMSPHRTDTPGVYTIDYPFKPGQTRVGSSFDVDYANERYTYEEPLQYDIDEFIAMTEDTTMVLESESLDLGETREVRGFKAYAVDSLSLATTLTLNVRGGMAHLHAPGRETPNFEIVTLQSPWESASVVLVFGFTLLLVLVMVYATRSPVEGPEQMALLASRKDTLLGQIAKLDDLFETGTVSDQLYANKRGERVDTLARIIHQIDQIQTNKSKSGRAKKGDAHAR